jgi:hypothetical protein
MNTTPNTVCELLYQLRDAVAADELAYALYLSREVHDKLELMIHRKEKTTCVLDCTKTKEKE